VVEAGMKLFGVQMRLKLGEVQLKLLEVEMKLKMGGLGEAE
jgi:hypothetical protein